MVVISRLNVVGWGSLEGCGPVVAAELVSTGVVVVELMLTGGAAVESVLIEVFDVKSGSSNMGSFSGSFVTSSRVALQHTSVRSLRVSLQHISSI